MQIASYLLFNRYACVFLWNAQWQDLLFYARFFEISLNHTKLEFVLAVHEDFTYDYESGKIIAYGFKEIPFSDYAEIVNNPDQRIRIVNVNGFLESYTDAHLFLNKKAQIMRRNLEMEFV